MIVIDKTRCVGCGMCVGDCFPGALELSEGTARLASPDACIGCGHCLAICPREAVSDPALPMDDVVPVRRNVNPEDLLDLMRSRRSCRHYMRKSIPEDTLEMLLNAARACPTAKNLQATRYIAVTEQIGTLLDAAVSALGQLGETQKKTAADPGDLRRAENFIRWNMQRQADRDFDPLFFHAPLLLMFIAGQDTARDAAAAAAYTELMAAGLGLGCLYSGYFVACAAQSPEISEILKLRPGEQVVRCLVLGYPDVAFRRTAPRKPADLTRM